MARAGVASRRESERMIDAGRVSLNGATVTHPATLVGAGDVVAIDGKTIAAREPSRIWLFHKPAGLVTTARDPEGRPTVFAALPGNFPRLISVGRLDINTEGLLILTNDGELARFMEHPARQFPRTYRVRVHGGIDRAAIAAITRGITIGGVRYRPARITIERRVGNNSWIALTLFEGKNREIKKMLGHFGLRVTRLIRIGYGPFELGDLPPGAVEEVPARILRKTMAGYFASREKS